VNRLVRRLFLAVLAIGLVFVVLPAARGEDGQKKSLENMPGIKRASFRFSELAEDGSLRIWGDVEIEAGSVRILADELRYDKASETIEAQGNVVLTGPGMVVGASRLFYTIEDGTGEVEDAVAYLEKDDAVLRARRMELLGKNKLRVDEAIFTTCTQPTPYWSFRIRRGIFNLGQYAYLHGVAFRAGRVPVFYTPYLIWPIKEDRASGLLFPEFGSADNLGQSIRIPFFWAFADNADATFNIDFYTRVGFGVDTELRWLPTPTGAAEGRLRYINDRVRHKTRYAIEWKHRQELRHDFKLTADIEAYSDFDYATDYETDLAKASTPQTVSTVDVSKDWSWYTLSMRARRHLQYFVGGTQNNSLLVGQVVNDLLPEVELRGRSQRLGTSPVYLSFETSVSGFSKRILSPPTGSGFVMSEDDLVTTVNNSWGRVDLAPKVRLPLVKTAWGDLQVTAGWRGTWYSHHRNPDASANTDSIASGQLFRSLWTAGFTFSGPRFQRVFKTPKWGYSPKLKHVIEPFVSYSWRPEPSTDAGEIIVFDEVDAVPGRLSDFRYGVRQRFYALRAPQTGRAKGVALAKEVSFDALERAAEENARLDAQAVDREDVEKKLDVEQTLNPTEFASIEISQSYSTIRELSRVYGVIDNPLTSTRDFGVVAARNYSPITIKARFNPTHEQSVDIGYTFDPANKVLTETRISTLLGFGQTSFFQGSWYRRRSANPAVTTGSSFLRSSWGMTVSAKLSFQIDWDFDLKAGEIDHQFYQLRYATQCCSFHLGYDQRDFVGNDRKEFRLVIDLAGIGKLLDLKDSR